MRMKTKTNCAGRPFLRDEGWALIRGGAYSIISLLGWVIIRGGDDDAEVILYKEQFVMARSVYKETVKLRILIG